MPYQISREGQLYGPYTLEDLQRYLASGNVLPTDLAKSEEMPDWLPVSQIVSQAVSHTAAAPATPPTGMPTQPASPGIATQPYYAPPAYTGTPSGSPYPDPPNLHWGLVLLIGVLTCGVFFVIWDLVQVLWARRVEPQTKALMYFIIYVVLSLGNAGGSFGRAALVMQGQTPRTHPFAILISILTFVSVIVYRFAMKTTLEQHFNGPEPIGLRLGPIMTFFFGGLYFQYHFNKINQMKQAYRYRSY